MRILVISDTHGKTNNYFDVLDKTAPIDMVIHCGDIGSSEHAITQESTCPVYCVSGNNDFFSKLPKELDLTIGKYKVWVTHGHYYGVQFDDHTIKDEAISRKVDIVMYGHSHRPLIDITDELIVINPGSISYPRQEGKRPSYILMEIDRFGEAHFTINYL